MSISPLRDCPCFSAKGVFAADSMIDICETCDWEDDHLQRDQPDFDGGANGPSLNQARENFKIYGHSNPEQLRRRADRSV